MIDWTAFLDTKYYTYYCPKCNKEKRVKSWNKLSFDKRNEVDLEYLEERNEIKKLKKRN